MLVSILMFGDGIGISATHRVFLFRMVIPGSSSVPDTCSIMLEVYYKKGLSLVNTLSNLE